MEPLADSGEREPEGRVQRGLDPAKVDAPKLETVVAQRMDEAFARPSVDQAIEELFTSLTDDRALAAQGEALFGALGTDPGLAARVEEFQDRLSNEPAMVALVRRLMADNPEASPDRIGELAGQFIDQQTESPTFDQAFDFAMDRLFERPKLKAAFDDFGEAVANNPEFERGLIKALHDIDYSVLGERVTAANGGTEPDAAGATQILIDHAFTTDRFEALALDWLHLPETRSELRRLASEVLRVPSVRRRLAALFARLLSDPDVQQRLNDCFVVMLDARPKPAEVKARFRRALDTPHMDAALASFVTELTQDPALQKLGSRFLERVANSRGFATSMQRFMSDW